MTKTSSGTAGVPISLDKFCKDSGRSRLTAWRWRQKGWLKTIDIAGKAYITPEALAEFNDRAARGEFKRKGSTFAGTSNPALKQGVVACS